MCDVIVVCVVMRVLWIGGASFDVAVVIDFEISIAVRDVPKFWKKLFGANVCRILMAYFLAIFATLPPRRSPRWLTTTPLRIAVTFAVRMVACGVLPPLPCFVRIIWLLIWAFPISAGVAAFAFPNSRIFIVMRVPKARALNTTE